LAMLLAMRRLGASDHVTRTDLAMVSRASTPHS
jgi:hypothetical protein